MKKLHIEIVWTDDGNESHVEVKYRTEPMEPVPVDLILGAIERAKLLLYMQAGEGEADAVQE